MEENIGVVVRVRPIMPQEAARGETPCVSSTPSAREVRVMTAENQAQAYVCSRCFPSDTSQEAFFAQSGVVDLLEAAMSGFHSCAFAFGQTGAGKTYTVAGPGLSLRPNHPSDGLLGRALKHLFNRLPQRAPVFIMKISCMEIYHEQVFDLSLPNGGKDAPLQVREHPQDGFYAEGCTQTRVGSLDEAVRVVDAALRVRHIGAHDMNSRSNRSHFITEIRLELLGDAADHRLDELGGIGGDGAEFSVLGKMTIIDLAGSERLKATNSSGAVLQDTGFINRSLYVLGKVIAGLVRNGPSAGGAAAYANVRDVPFRESKLTKLLVGSLGGTSKTLLISCVTEASGSVGETLRTLKFSMAAAKIKNRPIKFLDPQEKLILDLKSEIKRLRDENKFLIVSLMSSSQSPQHQQQLLYGAHGDGASVEGMRPSPRAVLGLLEAQRMDKQLRQQQYNHKLGKDRAHSVKSRKYQDLVELKKKRQQKNNAKRKNAAGGGGGGGKQRLQESPPPLSSPYLHYPSARPGHQSEAGLFMNAAAGLLKPLAQPMQSQSAADLPRPQYPPPAHADMYVFRTNFSNNNNRHNQNQGGSAVPESSNAMFPRSVVAPLYRQAPSAPTLAPASVVAAPPSTSSLPPVQQKGGAVSASRNQTKTSARAAPAVQVSPLPQPVTADTLKQKLAVLKFELEERKQWLEDNPAEATPEKEKQLANLMREVKEMHMEIKLVSQLEGISRAAATSPEKSSSAVSNKPAGATSSTSSARPQGKFATTKPEEEQKIKKGGGGKAAVSVDTRSSGNGSGGAISSGKSGGGSAVRLGASQSLQEETKLPSTFAARSPNPVSAETTTAVPAKKPSGASSGVPISPPAHITPPSPCPPSAAPAGAGSVAGSTRSPGRRTRGSAAAEDEYGDDDFYSGEDEEGEETYRDSNDKIDGGKRAGLAIAADSEDDAEAAAERALNNVIGRMVPVKSIGTLAAGASEAKGSTSPTYVSDQGVAEGGVDGEDYGYEDEGFEAADDPYGDEEFEQ